MCTHLVLTLQSRLPSSVSQRPVSGGGGKKDKPRVKSGEKKDVKSKDQKSKDPPAKPGKGSGKKDGKYEFFCHSFMYGATCQTVASN